MRKCVHVKLYMENVIYYFVGYITENIDEIIVSDWIEIVRLSVFMKRKDINAWVSVEPPTKMVSFLIWLSNFDNKTFFAKSVGKAFSSHFAVLYFKLSNQLMKTCRCCS